MVSLIFIVFGGSFLFLISEYVLAFAKPVLDDVRVSPQQLLDQLRHLWQSFTKLLNAVYSFFITIAWYLLASWLFIITIGFGLIVIAYATSVHNQELVTSLDFFIDEIWSPLSGRFFAILEGIANVYRPAACYYNAYIGKSFNLSIPFRSN